MSASESGSTAKHEAISASLRAQIKRGDIVDRLPSRLELARAFNVNFKTIDKSLGVLQGEQVVLLRRGLGAFVHPALKGNVVHECFFVFPGHRVLVDPANTIRFLVLQILDKLLTLAHEFRVELKFLPISPLNNKEVNWSLLAHLKKDDYALFLGVRHWQVIKKLARRGCRCLLLCDNPAVHGLSAAGLPLLSMDVSHPAMIDSLAEYFVRHNCRHPAAVFPTRRKKRGYWPSFIERLSDLCRERGMKFSFWESIEPFCSDDDLAEWFGLAFRGTPSVDAVFARREIEARRIREVLKQWFPSKNRSIRVIGWDNDWTWQGADSEFDVLRKPLDKMIRRLMEVVCGKQPFEPGHLAFPPCLETISSS